MFSARLAATLALLVPLAGCSKRDPGHASADAGAEAGAPALAVGDRVVVETAKATFVEGIVVSLAKDKVRVQSAATGDVTEHARADVYAAPPSSTTPAPPAGSFAVCRVSEAKWKGCRIEGAGAPVSVLDEDGGHAELAVAAVLAPTAVTELNVRQRFERNARRRAFREGADAAGRPTAPSGWRPKPGETVLGRRDGAWYGARVQRLKKSQAKLVWDDDKRVGEHPIEELVPQPPVDMQPLAGAFVLVRPPAGVRAWSVQRVESVAGSNLVVVDELGERRTVTLRDVLPLAR